MIGTVNVWLEWKYCMLWLCRGKLETQRKNLPWEPRRCNHSPKCCWALLMWTHPGIPSIVLASEAHLQCWPSIVHLVEFHGILSSSWHGLQISPWSQLQPLTMVFRVLPITVLLSFSLSLAWSLMHSLELEIKVLQKVTNLEKSITFRLHDEYIISIGNCTT